jgi:hypothetical protein
MGEIIGKGGVQVWESKLPGGAVNVNSPYGGVICKVEGCGSRMERAEGEGYGLWFFFTET